ncbi:hypothetical protein EMCRGX_G020366 [Ephydatia muelleri]|eukprot:Em0016g287a
MGRTVVLEEDELNRLTASARVGPYTGVLVGQTSEQKDFVVLIFPTPSLKEITGGEKLTVDGDWWVEEHSKQVSRMLPGGLAVIGLLLCCPAEEFKSQQARSRGLLLKMLTQSQSHGVVLHLCSKSRKYRFYAMDRTDSQSSLKPTEMKAQAFASSWYKLETSVVLDISVYTTGTKLEGLIQSSVQHILKGISEALGTVNGQLCRGGQPIAKLCGDTQGVGVTVPAKLHISKDSPSDPPTTVESSSLVKIGGRIKSYAYMNPKASCEETISALRCDLESSILNRCRAFCEDCQEEEDGDEKGKPKPASLQGGQLPRRVQVLLSTSPLLLTDYCFPDEDEEECKSRVAELVGADPSSITIQPLENFPLPPPSKVQTPCPSDTPSSSPLSAPPPANNQRVGVLPIAVGLAAIFIAILIWIMQTQS